MGKLKIRGRKIRFLLYLKHTVKFLYNVTPKIILCLSYLPKCKDNLNRSKKVK